MIDRRNFLIGSGAVLLLLRLPRFSFAAEVQARLVRIASYIPSHIFFPTRSSGAPVSLTALELVDEDKIVSGSFSNGQMIQFDSNSSSLNIVQQSGGRRVTRQSVLPKSLAAWVIDAVWRSIHNKLNTTTVDHLRDHFEGFQRQSVLEAVSPFSLYNLVRDSISRNQITSVEWNRETLRFEVK
jgi:hypothetical protein